MKKSVKNIVAIAIVTSLVLGIVIGANIASTIRENRMKVYAAEQEIANKDYVGYCVVENAMFPMIGNACIYQTAYEQYSHKTYYAMDVASDDSYFRAPFSGSIVNYKPDQGFCNEFIFQSTNIVRWADDSAKKMSIYVLHSEEADRIEELKMVPLKQGDAVVRQGKASGRGVRNEKYGNHLDIQVVAGAKDTFDGNAGGNGKELHYNAFFVGDEVSLSSESASKRTLGVPENIDRYKGLWVENNAFRYTESHTSNLKVTCPASIAFEERLDLKDLLFGHGLEDRISKLDTIKFIVNNYSTLDYERLSPFEKKAFDACGLEWVDSIPEPEMNETPSKNEKKITITFNAGEGASCDEQQREIAWGTCTYAFPTPFKLGDEFIAWFDDSGNEITCDSLITDNIVLHAKWKSEETALITAPPVTTSPEEETKVVSVEAEVKQAPNVVPEEPPQERVLISAESVKLNRTSKDLNLVGNSRSFTLTAEVFPTDAEDKTIRFESSNSSVCSVDANGNVIAKGEGTAWINAIASNGVSASCQVNVQTAYNTTYGSWSDYSKTPISPSDTIEVQTMETTEKVIDRYRCVYYCTMDLDGNRIYDSKSRNGDYTNRSWRYGEWSFAEQLKDPSHDYWDYTPGELGTPVAPGGYLDGNQAGYNGSNETLYTATYGWDVILVAIKDTLYKEVPVTKYRYRTITRVPVEFN